MVSISSWQRLDANKIRLSAPDETLWSSWCLTTSSPLPPSDASTLFSCSMAHSVFSRAIESSASGAWPHPILPPPVACRLLPQLLRPLGLSRETHQRLGCHLGSHQHYPLLRHQHNSTSLHSKEELPGFLRITYRHRKPHHFAHVAARIAHTHLCLSGHSGGSASSRISRIAIEAISRHDQAPTWDQFGPDTHTIARKEFSVKLEAWAACLPEQTVGKSNSSSILSAMADDKQDESIHSRIHPIKRQGASSGCKNLEWQHEVPCRPSALTCTRWEWIANAPNCWRRHSNSADRS